MVPLAPLFFATFFFCVSCGSVQALFQDQRLLQDTYLHRNGHRYAQHDNITKGAKHQIHQEAMDNDSSNPVFQTY